MCWRRWGFFPTATSGSPCTVTPRPTRWNGSWPSCQVSCPACARRRGSWVCERGSMNTDHRGTPDEVLDCRGQRCPLPVIWLARRLPSLPVGGVLRVLADDPAAAIDIPAWCRMRGQEYLGIGP